MLRRHAMRLRKWARYAGGRSYQHVPQGVGSRFEPWQLRGYFNDMRGKADWTGETGPHGVPLVTTDTHPRFAFPIVIFQWALGNWDRALAGDEGGRNRLVAAARWAVEVQDVAGGWRCWHALRRPVTSNYSAMAQGEGLSVLARAAMIDPAGPWAGAADRAYRLLVSGAEGLTRTFDGIVALEEYPGEAMRSVLNGWIFALIGIVDHAVLTGDAEVRATADALAADLVRALPRFDTGYWSTYDLAGNLASPFYHQLHIAQMDALALLYPDHAAAIATVRDRFARYAARRRNRALAIAVKLRQKLGQQGVGEMA